MPQPVAHVFIPDSLPLTHTRIHIYPRKLTNPGEELKRYVPADRDPAKALVTMEYDGTVETPYAEMLHRSTTASAILAARGFLFDNSMQGGCGKKQKLIDGR